MSSGSLDGRKQWTREQDARDWTIHEHHPPSRLEAACAN
jgi:hypothetical protein